MLLALQLTVAAAAGADALHDDALQSRLLLLVESFARLAAKRIRLRLPYLPPVHALMLFHQHHPHDSSAPLLLLLLLILCTMSCARLMLVHFHVQNLPAPCCCRC
jgi:hypothetical protein